MTSNSSEDDLNGKEQDKQSYASGKSIDSGLSDIFETSKEDDFPLSGKLVWEFHLLSLVDAGSLYKNELITLHAKNEAKLSYAVTSTSKTELLMLTQAYERI